MGNRRGGVGTTAAVQPFPWMESLLKFLPPRPQPILVRYGSRVVRLLVQQLRGQMTREAGAPGCRITVAIPAL
jgi:hypothetical protein